MSGDAGPWLALTARQVEVLRLLVCGLSNREIGAALGISTATAQRHVANVYRKLGVHTRVQAAAVAFRNGLAISTATQTEPHIKTPHPDEST